jgi:hypothetical protein
VLAEGCGTAFGWRVRLVAGPARPFTARGLPLRLAAVGEAGANMVDGEDDTTGGVDIADFDEGATGGVEPADLEDGAAGSSRQRGTLSQSDPELFLTILPGRATQQL